MEKTEKLDLILQEIGGIKTDVQFMKEELQSVKVDMKSVKEEVHVLKEDMKSVKEDMKSVKEEVQSLKEDMKSVKGELHVVKDDVQWLKDKVTFMDITLENETNRNIQLIAEGHMSLDRKLDEALKELHPNTMYHLKVNYLDGEVTKMKKVLNLA